MLTPEKLANSNMLLDDIAAFIPTRIKDAITNAAARQIKERAAGRKGYQMRERGFIQKRRRFIRDLLFSRKIHPYILKQLSDDAWRERDSLPSKQDEFKRVQACMLAIKNLKLALNTAIDFGTNAKEQIEHAITEHPKMLKGVKLSGIIYEAGDTNNINVVIYLTFDGNMLEGKWYIGPSTWKLKYTVPLVEVNTYRHQLNRANPVINMDTPNVEYEAVTTIKAGESKINPHIHRGQGGSPCLGGFSYPFSACAASHEWFGLLKTIIDYNSTVDKRDSWGKAYKLLPRAFKNVKTGEMTCSNKGLADDMGVKFRSSKDIMRNCIVRGHSVYPKDTYVATKYDKVIRRDNAVRISTYVSENELVQHFDQCVSRSHPDYWTLKNKHFYPHWWKKLHDLEDQRVAVIKDVAVGKLDTPKALHWVFDNRIKKANRDIDNANAKLVCEVYV